MVIATDWPRLAFICVLFTAAAGGVAWWAGLASPKPFVKAATRAVLQLAAVSAVITVVLARLPLTAAFLVLMAAVATATSAARTKTSAWVGVAILAGTVPAITALLATGLVPLTGVALIPIGGILIGGAMTATTLSTRRALDTFKDRYGEYEAALALGFTEAEATRELIRKPAAEALLPPLDQTRTVGLVTLPGAFVGMLLGGAPVWQAGALQLVVLVGLLAVEVMAVATVIELIARGRLPKKVKLG